MPADECVVDVSAEEASRVKSNLKNMDSGLAPYPYDEWKRWIALTNRISSATIGECRGHNLPELLTIVDLVAIVMVSNSVINSFG